MMESTERWRKMSFCIAIDGPAGAGKSTIARKLAEKMGMIYVDSGAMYRAMALFMLEQGIGKEDTEAMNGCCGKADITIRYENGEQIVYLNNRNVNSLIRTEEVSTMASISCQQPDVRKKLVSLQKGLARKADVVMDGRDIGTCVLPDADVKVYLTASVRTRAKRRYDELIAKGGVCDLNEIEKDIRERDERDMNRETAPLRQAKDAVLIDSSDMTIEEVVRRIVGLCE